MSKYIFLPEICPKQFIHSLIWYLKIVKNCLPLIIIFMKSFLLSVERLTAVMTRLKKIPVYVSEEMEKSLPNWNLLIRYLIEQYLMS